MTISLIVLAKHTLGGAYILPFKGTPAKLHSTALFFFTVYVVEQLGTRAGGIQCLNPILYKAI